MGLSSLPAPSEGMLCIILVNTALTFSIFKNFIRTILRIFGFRISASSSSPPPSSTTDSIVTHQLDFSDFYTSPTETYIEQFRSQTPTVHFESVCGLNKGEHDCSVCLTQFEPDSEVNHLSCGHIFHNVCLEQWLDYCNITCPLCRNLLMPEEDVPCFW
ncbi:probable E3 ubiquitin-protein ligase XERICO [Punica granatum]|uniref:RING-type domain-containing protein n=2 Tax=Punica granatum TaxID=22663 RepID=A0A218X9B4_PUNGR|nr:probable E3 ubiquitin-protein ligase XERICO [Punica granatum]OWM81533.1 hypothetical protein CDL15_Pgr007571 [Punica granatum]PKI41080.1 hypothetical protein CRG98_038608 [Punica granatum]